MEPKKLFFIISAILLSVVGLNFISSNNNDLMSAQLFGNSVNYSFGNPSLFSVLMSATSLVERIPQIKFEGIKKPSGSLSIGSINNLVHGFKVVGDKKQDVILYEINVFVQSGNNLISLNKPAIRQVKIYDSNGYLVGISNRIVPEVSGAGIVFVVPVDIYLPKKDKLTFTVRADIEGIDSKRVVPGVKFWINMAPQDIYWKSLDGERSGSATGKVLQPRSGLFTVTK